MPLRSGILCAAFRLCYLSGVSGSQGIQKQLGDTVHRRAFSGDGGELAAVEHFPGQYFLHQAAVGKPDGQVVRQEPQITA